MPSVDLKMRILGKFVTVLLLSDIEDDKCIEYDVTAHQIVKQTISLF